MSRQRSRSESGRRDYSTGDLLDLYNTVTSDTVPSANSNRKRSRSVSRNPTDRVPLDQDSSNNTRPSGRFPASFESLAEPQFRSTPPPHTPTQKPIKGILKTSSRSPSTPIRPSSAVSFETSAPANGYKSYRPSFVRSYSSISFNSSQTPAATPKVPEKPSDTPSQNSTMSGKATGRAKARDATALYDVGASPQKKAGRINGSAKKTVDVSDEGSSSSDEESESSSSEEESESEDEDKGRQNTAAPATEKKAAPAPADDSSDSESESSDSDDEPAKEAKKPAPASAVTNGAEESSSEEESDSASGGGGAKVASAKGAPNSSSSDSSDSEDEDESESAPAKAASKDESSGDSSDEESDEDSDEEMADAPTSAPQPSRGGMVRAAQRAPTGPPPSAMEGGFKLQTAQNMGHMASVLSEAKAKGDRVWLLTHPSTTPLNLEVQKILPSSENHRNSIFPNGAKLTYPAAADGKNVHVICKLSLIVCH